MNGTDERERFEAQLKAAEADLAFALAQGDGYAEDDAAQRIVDLKEALRRIGARS
jgi:hypothetical protein